MGRLIVVSNRVPSPRQRTHLAGGLAVGLRDAVQNTTSIWFGWSGRYERSLDRHDVMLDVVGEITYATIHLTHRHHTQFYENFSNGLLWPLFHYRIGTSRYKRDDYDVYREVNALFADKLADIIRDDDTIWVHDYHLLFLAEELRHRNVRAKIGFFSHIPFPPWSVLRVLPCAEAIMQALVKCDLIGVQTAEDLMNLNNCLTENNLSARTERNPIGIDPEELLRHAQANENAPDVRRFRAGLEGRKIVLGVDRLDYSKGIHERLQGFENFLKNFPHLHGKVVLLQITPLSRKGVQSYRTLRHEVNEMAGHINAKYGNFDWLPVQYLTQPVSRPVLAGFLRMADVGFVTPIRDGMNLVAKEFVAAQDGADPGALILSSLAGAAEEMEGAILVNPYDKEQLSEALNQALTMEKHERIVRWRTMYEAVTRNTAASWADNFLDKLRRD